MLIQRKLLVLIALGMCTALASADSLVYVVTTDPTGTINQFGTVSLTTGAFQPIGANTTDSYSNLVPGPSGTLYSLDTVTGNLVTINPVTGVPTVIGPTGLGFFSATGLSMAFSLAEVNGTLYLTDFNNNLYTVNASNGAATLIGPTGMPPDPAAPFTMNADGTINLCDESLSGVGGKLYATFDSFNFDPNSQTITQVKVSPDLWQIDPSTGIATLIAPTKLNLDGSFDANGIFYAFYLNAAGAVELDTLDLSNGNTGFVQGVDPSAGLIFGATPVVTPEPASLALVGTGLAAVAAGLRRLRS